MALKKLLSPEFKEKTKIRLGLDSRVSILKKILPANSIGVELGVFKGEFTHHILKYNRPKKLILIDVWWTHFGENYPNWGKYTDFGKLKTKDAYNETVRITRKFPKTETEILVGDDLEHLQKLPDNYLDWAYIDSSHAYEHTLNELELLNRKVKNNGIISGHDWTEDSDNMHVGVSMAVKEFCAKQAYELFYLDEYTQWAIRKKANNGSPTA